MRALIGAWRSQRSLRSLVNHDGASLGGYARLLARPDLAGGDGRLGYWNLYGSALERMGPWVSLDPRAAVLRKSSGAWSDLHLKIEGPGPLGADAGRGSLETLGLTQAHSAGASQGSPYTLRVGSLATWYGDLGSHDMRPARLFDGALGVALEGRHAAWSYLVGVGDAGFGMKGAEYNAVVNAGASVHYRTRRLGARRRR